MKAEETPLYEMDNEYLNKSYDLFGEGIDHQLEQTKLFEACNGKILMTGSNGGWRGRSDYESTILDSIVEFCNRVTFENVNISVYSDRVEISNAHHDSTNYYTLKRFSWDDLAIRELKNVIINDGLWDDLREYLDEVKSRDVRKWHYVEFLDDKYESETFNTSEPE